MYTNLFLLITILPLLKANSDITIYGVFNRNTFSMMQLTISMKEILSKDEKILLTFKFVAMVLKIRSPYLNALYYVLDQNLDPTPFFNQNFKRNEFNLKIFQLEIEIPNENYEVIYYMGFRFNYDMIIPFISKTKQYVNVFLKIIVKHNRFCIEYLKSGREYFIDTKYISELKRIFKNHVKKVNISQNLNDFKKTEKQKISVLWSFISILACLMLSSFIGFMRQSNRWKF